MKKPKPQLLKGLTPEHPDDALPCLTATAQPRPDRYTAESELKRAQREYATTGRAIQQLQNYLNTLPPKPETL